MLYLDSEDLDRVADLRRSDPHGRQSNSELEQYVLRVKLQARIAELEDENLRDILETIVHLM